MPIFSRKKPDEQAKKPDDKPKEQAEKPDELVNISEKVELQGTPQPAGAIRKAETAAAVKERELKAGDLVKQLKPSQLSMLKGLAVIKKKGPEALTNDSFKEELKLSDLMDFINTAEVNRTSITIMEGQLLRRLAEGRDQMAVEKYQNNIAGLNTEVNKLFSTTLEQDPKKIAMH